MQKKARGTKFFWASQLILVRVEESRTARNLPLGPARVRLMPEETGAEFVTLSTTQVFADMGVTTRDARHDPVLRLQIQEELIRRCNRVFFEPKGDFISDRTPIDVAAYTLADAVEGFYSEEQWFVVERIVKDAIEITNSAFHFVLMLRPEPIIGYSEEKGKPAADLAYQAHHDLLVAGLLREEGLLTPTQKMRRGKCLSIEERLGILRYIEEAVLARTKSAALQALSAAGYVTTEQ